MCIDLLVENILIERKTIGSVLHLEVSCNACGFSYTTRTSSVQRNKSTLDYLISCAVLFTGSLPAKAFRYAI